MERDLTVLPEKAFVLAHVGRSRSSLYERLCFTFAVSPKQHAPRCEGQDEDGERSVYVIVCQKPSLRSQHAGGAATGIAVVTNALTARHQLHQASLYAHLPLLNASKGVAVSSAYHHAEQ